MEKRRIRIIFLVFLAVLITGSFKTQLVIQFSCGSIQTKETLTIPIFFPYATMGMCQFLGPGNHILRWRRGELMGIHYPKGPYCFRACRGILKLNCSQMDYFLRIEGRGALQWRYEHQRQRCGAIVFNRGAGKMMKMMMMNRGCRQHWQKVIEGNEHKFNRLIYYTYTIWKINSCKTVPKKKQIEGNSFSLVKWR